MATHITPETNLGLHHREFLKQQFKQDLATGTTRQLVIPLDALGTFLIPVIYLCIPHTRRPWLYRMRFAVMALMMWFNYDTLTRAASTSMHAAYAAGLTAAWGTLWGMTVLIWMKPQFEAERVNRRLRKATKERNGSPAMQNGHSNGELLHRHPKSALSETQLADKLAAQSSAPDETVAAALSAGYEYYWQSYPATSPLSTRLDWVVDYVISFRGLGWSTTSISSAPSFRRPSKTLSSAPVHLASIPVRSKTGYSRSLTVASFLRDRALRLAASYLALDLCTVLMLRDPYFILGPDHSPYPLPAYLPSSPILLLLIRNFIALAAIISALYIIFSLGALSQFLLSHSHPILTRLSGARSDLWQYPDVFGSFSSNVLDHGLAGFWGGWWHQTFRGAFVAPTNFMVRKGWLPRDKRHPLTRLVGAAVAFVQSGMLHAAGSYSTLSKTARPWSPPLFFLASLVGVLVQAGWGVFAGKLGVREHCPLWIRRGANLLFVVGWLCGTSWLFVDDLCRAGVWLYEPLPFSVLRAMGLGLPGDKAWRWDADVVPRLWTGVQGRWWESGIAI